MTASDPTTKVVKVSVCMITYNHEAFIAQAIESVLMQEAGFEYELVIGEDCSTDGTRAIVRDYGARYPEQIRLLLPERNRGMTPNFVATLAACRGQYIAVLEGDDYWTDPHKLQKQVDLLDAQPDIAICYHHCEYLHDDGTPAPQLPGVVLRKPRASLPDLLYPVVIPTCSVVFRHSALGPLPDWFFTLPWVDWSLWLLLAQWGDVAYLEESMAVYRVHAAGVSKNWMPGTLLRGRIDMFGHVNEHLHYRYDSIIRARLSAYYLQLSAEYADLGDSEAARRCLRRTLQLRPFTSETRKLDLAVMVVRLYATPVYRVAKRLVRGLRKQQDGGGVA